MKGRLVDNISRFGRFLLNRPASPYCVGQQVKISSGPFEGLVCSIIEIDKNGRLVVHLELKRGVKAHLPAECVTSAGHAWSYGQFENNGPWLVVLGEVGAEAVELVFRQQEDEIDEMLARGDYHGLAVLRWRHKLRLAAVICLSFLDRAKAALALSAQTNPKDD